MRVNADEQRIGFRDRHNHCPTSSVYREKVRIINEKLAERYGKNPTVAVWHLSNEYNGQCFCPLCRNKFREWLAARYENDINKLNHAWRTRFWSHRYDGFQQIEPPFGTEETNIAGLNSD